MRRAHVMRTVLLATVVVLIVGGFAVALTAFAARENSQRELPVQPIQGSKVGETVLGTSGWQVMSSADITERPAQISDPKHSSGKGWLVAKPDDAGAPGTILGVLLQNGECPNVFFSQNMRDCFGYATTPGPVEVPRFAVPWWFRTDFDLGAGLEPGQHAAVEIPGVVGEADVWLNGSQIATRDLISGAYAGHSLDITTKLRPGKNSLAIMMYPDDVAGMFTLSNADWNQFPPDNNTGIQYPIRLRVTGGLGQSDSHVLQRNAADLSSSELTVKLNLVNRSGQPRRAEVQARITPPGGGDPIVVSKTVDVPASNDDKKPLEVRLDPTTIAHPKLWWPYSMGDQPLYTLDVAVSEAGAPGSHQQSDSAHETFGVRTVTSRLIGQTPEAPAGWRQFAINGRDLFFRGGEYGPDLFLRYSKQDTARQVALIKNMGLIGVRMEGHDQPDDFYEQMDRAGLLVLGGFMCCSSWQPETDSILTERDVRIIHDSAKSIGQRERDHPSVFTYGWSDNEPTERQERASLRGFAEADFNVPIIASAMYKSTPTLGWSGEREGPYDWVPPIFWYDTGHTGPNNDTLTNVSGSRGFASEESAGNTIPTLASLRRFLSPEELDKLWRDPNYNQYHTNYQAARGGHNLHGPASGDGYAFGTLYNFNTALYQRYGPWSDLESYVQHAQLANYENVRAQFEASVKYSTDPENPATGMVYFMINKGWPSLLWTLYNSDYDQPGSYFGAQEANKPLHALFSYDDNTVTVANFSQTSQDQLTVQSRVIGLDGQVLDDQQSPVGPLSSQAVRNGLINPALPDEGPVYFVELLLKRGDAVVDRNVYWRSTAPDDVDWDAHGGNRVNFPSTPMRQWADFKALSSLPPAQVSVTTGEPQSSAAASAGSGNKISVTLTNTSDSVAFFLRADLPQAAFATWDQNNITLFPGESQTVTATYEQDGKPQVTVSGVNMAEVTVN